MLLFKEQESRHRDLPSTETKRLRFRRQIRQASMKARFEEVRVRLVEDLHSQILHEVLSRLNQGFQPQEFKVTVQLLEGNCDNVHFNTIMADQKLGDMLVDVLLANSKELALEETLKVIDALSHLTYFSAKAVSSLINKESFFDYLRRSIQALHMDDLRELPFFNSSLSLLMNISSQLKHEFNLFLAESDLSLVINRQLIKTIVPRRTSNNQRYITLVDEARDFALKLFFNIVNGMDYEKEEKVVARLAGDVLKDQQNLLRYPYRTFMFLAQCMGNKKFWPMLMEQPDSNNYFIQVCHSLDTIQERCYSQSFLNCKENNLTTQQKQQFYGAIYFLNQLFYQDEEYQLAFVSLIQNMLNGYMLAEFIIESHQDKNKQHLTAGIKLLWHLSKTIVVTAEQLIIVRPADDPLELLKVIMDPQLLKSGRMGVGHYCLHILQVVLQKDQTFLKKLMELRVLDKLSEFFEFEKDKIDLQVLSKSIELAIELIKCAKLLGEDSEMVGLMGQKGIIDFIEKCLDHKDVRVYIKAQEFMEAVSDQKKRH